MNSLEYPDAVLLACRPFGLIGHCELGEAAHRFTDLS